MKKTDFTAKFTVNCHPSEVFRAVNNVTGWWTENLEGKSQKLNDEFTVRFGDVHYSKQKLIEVVEDKKVVWLVTESELTFVKNRSEWTGTKIVFEIFPEKNGAGLRFTHEGLVPGIECYGACSGVWSEYLESLQDLITKGKGKPDAG